jgi:coenzyme F420-reducing hydrogenase delta subunit/Pyruvate/2-oxoacid:ferredoxin oxidoreductase delta subunit
MSVACPLKPLHVIIMHGPELVIAGLDPWDFSLAVAGLPSCRVLLVDPALPLSQQEDRVRVFLSQEQEINPVILVAKDPEHRGAGVIRLLLDELRLNPEFLVLVDLTAALEHPEGHSRTTKGLELIRLAAAQVSRAWPITRQDTPVSRQVLVWGDSSAGLKAAWELAELGYPVLLASPRAELQPLALGPSPDSDPPERAARLIRQVQEHDLIRTVEAAAIADFSGVTGNFSVSLETPQGRLTEPEGAVVLAPELQVAADPGRYGLPEHPAVVSLLRLEELLAAGFLEEEPKDVALLVGLAGASHPLALGRALDAGARLLAAEHRVFLLVGNAKVAGPGLGQAMRTNQEAGMVLVRLRERPTVIFKDERPLVNFFEPTLRQELSLPVDLVAFDEKYLAAPDNARVAALLRVPLTPQGFLQADNVHYVPAKTPRRGIYAVGPGRGAMAPAEADADVAAAVLEIQSLLGRGTAPAPQGRAVVDRGRCALCLTCHRLCPHGAITWDSRAVINELACQGCGICASQCPNVAIQIRNFTDDQMAALMWAFNPQLTPRIVAFMCRNSAWEAYQTALKRYHAGLPLGFTPIKMPCAGKVDVDYLLRAFTHGADGVLVLACPPDNCQSSQGNRCAAWRTELAQGLLAETGIDPGRVLFKSLAANAPRDFLETVAQFLEYLQSLAKAA